MYQVLLQYQIYRMWQILTDLVEQIVKKQIVYSLNELQMVDGMLCMSIVTDICDRWLALLQLNELSSKIADHRKDLLEICSKARNEYSKHQIRRDFRAGMVSLFTYNSFSA